MISSSLVAPKTERLAVSRFKYSLAVESPIYFSNNKGATLRGGFGNSLKNVTCTNPDTECGVCPLYRVCTYPSLFETPPPVRTTRMRKGLAIPRPFVIEPPSDTKSTYLPGEDLTFGLVLIGQAINSLPYFTRAFENLGERGLGKRRGNFKVKEVQTIKVDPEPLSPCQKIRLRFLSPTRIILDGQTVIKLSFPLFFRTLSRRIENLSAFHGGFQEHEPIEDLANHLKTIQISSQDLRWHKQERYSRRQQRVIPQGGFVGEICFEGDLEPFLPFLKLGELVHVGKGATFGMGRYEVVLEEGIRSFQVHWLTMPRSTSPVLFWLKTRIKRILL